MARTRAPPLRDSLTRNVVGVTIPAMRVTARASEKAYRASRAAATTSSHSRRTEPDVIASLALALLLVPDTGRSLPAGRPAVSPASVADTGRAPGDTLRPPADTLRPGTDTLRVHADSARPAPRTIGEAEQRAAAQDTVPRRRRRVTVEYSDAYGQRLTWHRWLSYPIVPLFAAQWYLGEQLMQDQQGASDATKVGHRTIATLTAGIYTANTITGLMNLWEGRDDPSGRLKKWVHAISFVAADAAFIYGATLAQRAQVEGAGPRELHRTVELSAIGISVASWAMMLLWKD